MWACEPIKFNDWGYFQCGERKYFDTLNQARAYAHEAINMWKHNSTNYGRYHIYKVGGVPMQHHIDGTKSHFVTFCGCWFE